MKRRSALRAPGLVAALFCVATCTGVAQAHRGHGDRAAWDACAGRSLDAPCAWQDAEHSRYIGTCRSVADALVCVRNQPIERANPQTSHESSAHNHTHDDSGLPFGLTLAFGLLAVAGVALGSRRGKAQTPKAG